MFHFLQRLSILARLRWIAAFVALMTLALSAFGAWCEYRALHAARQQATQHAVQTAQGVLEWAHAQEQAGRLTREQAQAQAVELLRGTRYGGQEYFFIIDREVRSVLHPIKPALEGTDVSQLKANGVAPFVLLVAQAQRAGHGFVSYHWPKPGSEVAQEKLSYVQLFSPWGWVLGTGVYVDDLRAMLWATLRRAMLGGAVVVVLNFLMIGAIGRSLAAGLREAVQVSRRIASGDVSHEVVVHSRDEVGALLLAMRDMSAHLNANLQEVRSAADALAQASDQLMAGNADLASRTEETSSSLQQTAASMQQLTSAVQQNAQASEQVQHQVNEANALAAQGGETVAQVVTTMQDINAASKRIAEIIGVIDGIAFQTNILALNAAVEAARAGEQGRGFAVVAAEVRSLAGRSAEAAREIKQLIGGAVERIENGAGLVSAAGSTMVRVVGAVREVETLIEGIARANGEQHRGIVEINAAVGGLDHMTQQNAALVEEASSATVSLSTQASRLTQVVARFKLSQPSP